MKEDVHVDVRICEDVNVTVIVGVCVVEQETVGEMEGEQLGV